MKKKLNKIAALVLALVMVITGFVAVPQMGCTGCERCTVNYN